MTSSDGIGASISGTPSGRPDEASAPIDFTARAKLPFPVVGIGASAGGIEALQRFLSSTPADSGMAFIVVQHLSPEHRSFMADILSRSTDMPVHQIEDGMRVEPNHVYVIRPGYTVTLEDGKLHLTEPIEKRGHRRPVDELFRSLAREQKEHAIAVVLSGTGTNGSAGAQAVKAVGGLCFAQEPDSADFPGMPQSLIYAGYADQVLKPEEMGSALVRYIRNPYLDVHETGRARAAQEFEIHRQHLSEVIATVRTRTGHDFAPYKPPTVLRRIQRRMGLIGITEIKQYASYLREHTAEVAALTNDLMIIVTGFFRDADAWEAMREAVVRPLVEQRASGEQIRAWVTACASGEEAYTLAMLIAEELHRVGKSMDIKIFATDTADKSLALARAGVYPGGIEGDLSPERLDRFFEKDEHTYRVKKMLREWVVFAPQDVLRDPPFSRVDIVTCRNLLIYLEPEAQRRALGLMHFALREGGYLFLGNSETLGDAGMLFEIVSKRWRIFRRVGTTHRFAEMPPITSRLTEVRHATRTIPTATVRPSATAMIQSALLNEFAPPTAVVDINERILYFHGDASPYLQHPSGETTQHLIEMVRAPLRAAVRNVLRTAISERRAVTAIVESETDMGRLSIAAAPLKNNRPPDHFRVTFMPAAVTRGEFSPGSEQLVDPKNVAQVVQLRAGAEDSVLEEELRILRRELQISVEAFEATNEELKASNEEVTSINEELQSTNEELETGKEELQSLNEELVTVNSQLQTKLVELEALTNDLDNLLASTDIAVVFLDTKLNVRRFTAAVSDLLELIPTDIGRPLAHLAQKFRDGDLIADAAQVIAKLVPLESEVHSHSGRWYLRRTLPYRTEDNRIAGAVITFIDITARKHAEQSIEAIQRRLQAVIEQMPTAVLMAEAHTGNLLLANRHASTLFNQPYPLPFIGHHWSAAYSAFRGSHRVAQTPEMKDWPLARAIETGAAVLDEEFDFKRADGAIGTLAMSASPVRDQNGEIIAAVAAFWDITERKRAELALRDSEERFRVLVESAHDYGIFLVDRDGRVASWNRGAERVTGYTEEEILGKPGAVLFTPEDQAAGAPEQEMRNASEKDRALDERWHMRKDGSRFWASGVMTAVRDSRGNLRGYVKIMRDQTERQEMDARLQEALQSAQQLRAKAEGANRAKDEFISTVSHELRTPLNTIRLWSRMFASGKVHDKDVIEGGKVVDRAALAQQQLIDDLLDVSRMATGQLRLTLRDTRLTESVRGAIGAIQPLAASRQIDVHTNLSPEVGVVHVDPDRIQQIVWNLLANAVKFTPERGKVFVRMRRNDGTVEIEVVDTGIGIKPDFLPFVFDRFRQGEAGSARRFAGIGLGLAIAKQLAELHGGTIRAHSEGEGKGATFQVLLPLERRPESFDPEKLASGNHSAIDLRGVEVLVVEDVSAARQAVQLLLEGAGAQVRSATCAALAVEAFTARRPNILVADIGMPDEDGYSMMKRLRQIEQEQGTARVPAVAVTAFARTEDRERALAAGFDDHLPKPINPDVLMTTIVRLTRSIREKSAPNS